MVQVKLLNATQDYIIIEYLTNGITISVKINNDAPVQDMIIKGYNEIKPHIDIECKRLGITDIDHTLPIIDDEIVSIEILGIENINFTEGQQAIEKHFRCRGITLYGKIVDLTEEAEFTPSNPIIISPSINQLFTITAKYNDLEVSKNFNVYYKSLAEIEIEKENSRINQENLKEQQFIENKNNELNIIKKQLDDSDYRPLKFIDESYTAEEYEPYRLERITLREKYNLIESCTTQEELDELI